MKIMISSFVVALCLVQGAVASTYCGQFQISYVDGAEGGPGAIYSLNVATYIDQSEGGSGSNLKVYSLNTKSKNAAVSSLSKSIVQLLEDQKSYCFEGTVKGSSLSFTAVSKE